MASKVALVLFLALFTAPYAAASGALLHIFGLLLLSEVCFILQSMNCPFISWAGLFPSSLWSWFSTATKSWGPPGHHPPHDSRPGYKWDQFLPIPRDLLFEAELAASDDIIAMLEDRLHHTSGNMRILNSSQLMPLLPIDIAWMIDYTERRMGRFNPDVTQTMAADLGVLL